MVSQLSNFKRAITSRLVWTIWLEAFIALGLMVLGAAGALFAMQSRPYLGEAATDLTQVPVRVITSPNVPALAAFVVALGLGVTGAAWFIVRLVHWRFFAPVAAHRVWRQALFLGVLTSVLAWLKVNQSLAWPLAVIIIVAFALIEIYLSLRSTPQSDKQA
ncbi:MAG: hypothetical protein HY870_00505 [Chloroflexi bacterium]|nr:hypothetical protein [Chloroflexota bacterium]